MASNGGTTLMTRLREFIKDVRVESTKISWPTRNELRASTVVVIVTVIILTIFVYLADTVLRMGIGLLFQ